MSGQQRPADLPVLRDGDERSACGSASQPTSSVSSPPQDERDGETGLSSDSAHGEEGLSSSRSEHIEDPSRTTAKRWTSARQAAFLRALEETLSVGKAAKSVGMSRQSAYKLRKRMAGQPFAEGWERAVADLRLDDALAPLAGSQRCPVCGAAPAWPTAAPPGRAPW